ncbi:MAG: hypothetical protein IPO27_10365 [Bacteroidetes bacterium]|nr:hypothetical protein [Bacteroidota bacterium]
MKKIILLKTMFCMSFLTMQLQAQLPTVQDCPCAIPICQNIYNEVNSYVGTGSLPQEINSVISCLGQGEKNSVWYTFTVQSSGSLNFSITPNVLMDDYDWAVYNLTNNNCSDIFSNPSLEAACNYAGAPGVTGPNGLPGAQNEPPIPVLVGQTYIICVSQFTSSPNGYSINFSASTASIIDITPPTIDSVNTNFVCGQDSFLVTFSENIQCSSVQPSDFELRDPSLTLMTIDSVVAVNCNSICGYSRTFIFYFSPPVNILGTYNLQIVNTIDDICGNSCLIPTIINFNVSAYTYANTSVNVACPGGTNGSINVVVTSPGVYSYLWSGSQTTANVTGLGPGTYTVTVTKGGGCPDLITFTITAPAAFTYTTASTNAGCGQSNGTASINVTGGGTGPYTYNWSTGATTSTAPNVANGTYTVTVTDFKGCTFTATVAVNATAGVTATIPTSVNVKCFNAATGSANSAANNGSGTYTYLWSNGQTLANASTLAAGTYTVTITDVNGGCTATATVVITQPATAVSGISTTAATKCNLANGLAYVTAAGGLGPYTYVWSNGVSNDSISLVAAATYTVTITDANNCTVTVTASVAASLAVTGTVPAQVNVSCNGGSNGTGTAGCNNCTGAISYAWSNGQTTQTAIGLAAGTFTVTVTDANGCTGTGAVTITQPTALSIINAINDTVCLTQISSITPNGSGGTGPYTFLWNNGNTNALLAVSPGGTTTYTVTVTDNKLCTKTASVTVYVRPALTVSTNNDTTICSGSQVSISATSGGGSGTYTYNWNNGLNALQNFNITPVSDTTLLIQLTDNCGSPAVYDTVHIYVSTPMVISFPVVNNVKCNGGNTGDATASVLNGITPYSYLWSNGQTTINATGLSAGTYTITVTDNQNCTMSATVSITQPAALVISSLPGDTICQTKNGALLPVVAGGTVAYSYLWSNGNTNSSLIISPGSTTSYTVTVTDANNCTTTASAQIWVLPALSIVASNDTTICFGASATISAQGSGGDNIYTYTWNGNVGGTSQLVSPTQDTTLVIMLSDVCGSPVVYDTVKITVIPEIVASTISIVNVSCFNGSNGSAQVSHIGGLAPFSFYGAMGKQQLLPPDLQQEHILLRLPTQKVAQEPLLPSLPSHLHLQ